MTSPRRAWSNVAVMEFTNLHPALPHFWHPVAVSDDVGGTPVGIELAGQRWALLRLDGEVRAFADQCPHRRARLSAGTVVDGTLECRYHGWRYTGEGACVSIPALGAEASIPPRARLTAAAEVTEADGLIWLAPQPPRAPRPSLQPPPVKGDDIATIHLPVMRVDTNAALLIDNFLDEAHLPFVHQKTIGGAGPEVIPRADIDRHALQFTAIRTHEFTNRTDPAVLAGERPAVQKRRMTYGYTAPLHATLLLEMIDADDWQYLTFTVSPVNATSCLVFQTLTGPRLTDPIAAKAAADYEMSIFEEDLDLQRSALHGLEFPLAMDAELHTRADRVCVEFRRVLGEALAPGAASC